jgi:AraC-like DNA-binding protein
MSENAIHAKSYSSVVHHKDDKTKVIYRSHHYSSMRTEVDIHGDFWSLGFFEFPENAGFVKSGKTELPLTGKMVLFLPHFTTLQWRICSAEINWNYLISQEPICTEIQGRPLLFNLEDFGAKAEVLLAQPTSAILQWVKARQHLATLIEDVARPCSKRVKQQIDKEFRSWGRLQELVKPLNHSFAYLSRQFKKDYGLSPVRYRNGLRMIQASVDMLFKEKPVESIQIDLGIEDSSYFYQSFRSYLKTQPSEFRRARR